MTKQEFINRVGFTPANTAEATVVADVKGITFKRRNAHLRAWFNPAAKGRLQPSTHNLRG